VLAWLVHWTSCRKRCDSSLQLSGSSGENVKDEHARFKQWTSSLMYGECAMLSGPNRLGHARRDRDHARGDPAASGGETWLRCAGQKPVNSPNNEENIIEAMRREYQAKMEGQLLQWDARLQTIKSIARNAGAEAQREMHADLTQLERLYALGKEQLAGLESAAEASMKAGLDEVVDSWNKVSGTTDAIWARIQAKLL